MSLQTTNAATTEGCSGGGGRDGAGVPVGARWGLGILHSCRALRAQFHAEWLPRVCEIALRLATIRRCTIFQKCRKRLSLPLPVNHCRRRSVSPAAVSLGVRSRLANQLAHTDESLFGATMGWSR